MPASISPISTPVSVDSIRPAGAAPSGGFQNALSAALEGMEQTSAGASESVERFLGGEGELHTAVLSAQRAELTFDLFLQARNKVVNAYQEIMRMQM